MAATQKTIEIWFYHKSKSRVDLTRPILYLMQFGHIRDSIKSEESFLMKTLRLWDDRISTEIDANKESLSRLYIEYCTLLSDKMPSN